MFQLPCQNCSSPILVSPSQAGDSVTCVQCGETVAVPKLGELRKLPSADTSTHGSSIASEHDAAGGSRIGFIVAAFLATACLLIASFCAVRWSLVEVPVTTEQHIAEYAEAYKTAAPAALIGEFEEMEERGLEMPAMYNYKTLELTKRTWGRNALVAGGLGLAALVAAVLLSMSGRKQRGV
tara:strand:+ start:36903 stop:37445 length:543 start_codon:yes stop_codon:yes gene_type:complete